MTGSHTGYRESVNGQRTGVEIEADKAAGRKWRRGSEGGASGSGGMVRDSEVNAGGNFVFGW